MGAWDAINHLLNLFWPGLALAAVAAAAAKGLWRQRLRARTWAWLAGALACANVGVATAGLLISGHDGRMATWVVMVLGDAAVLLWALLRPQHKAT